ncbi:hypothetical protein J2S34_003303 [Nitrobacter winogradskyi]|uniref:Uncharacterized protein n=2 Tax=Nitrobacter winogradskyi TaxID=913 RepID=A0ACC6APQ7_NITWI|nr:hypothetical protein [Nitrobacter winogradskyi]MCP2000855.1 hypothetical protein [Nitrobacter winogradskyi]GEC17071.1 hypothetical protein NWI01_29630 [Nitrobacter winogradskyi]
MADGVETDGAEADGAELAGTDEAAAADALPEGAADPAEDGDGDAAWCWARTVVDGTRTANNAANVRWIVAFASLTIMLFVPDICWLASAIILPLKLLPKGKQKPHGIPWQRSRELFQ